MLITLNMYVSFMRSSSDKDSYRAHSNQLDGRALETGWTNSFTKSLDPLV